MMHMLEIAAYMLLERDRAICRLFPEYSTKGLKPLTVWDVTEKYKANIKSHDTVEFSEIYFEKNDCIKIEDGTKLFLKERLDKKIFKYLVVGEDKSSPALGECDAIYKSNYAPDVDIDRINELYANYLKEQDENT